MKQVSDRLHLAPNWHVDCRLVAELPEDSVVGMRFIAYGIPCVIALAFLLFTGWYGYTSLSLRHQIEEGNRQLEDDYWDVAEIRRLQRFYEIEAKKIENAYAEIKAPILISGFISELGRTLPDRMLVDSIEYGDSKISVRGRLRETPERASQMIAIYVDKMRANPAIGTHFNSSSSPGWSAQARTSR